MACVSQVQLAQPLLILDWSAALRGEQISGWTIVIALAVLTCVAAIQRIRVHRAG